MAQKVLVIGGAGAFGRRLVHGLLATTDLEVVVGGRDLARAQAAADEAREGDQLGRATAMALDTGTATAAQLRETGAAIVVDAAGPFQGQGYHLAEQAIEAGLDYVDLADSREFVSGFRALDERARRVGTTALSAVTPARSARCAVVTKICSASGSGPSVSNSGSRPVVRACRGFWWT